MLVANGVRFVFLPLLLVTSPVLAQVESHGHDHGDSHHHHHLLLDSQVELLTIDQVLALERNRDVDQAARLLVPGRSGNGELNFEVIVKADSLPKQVFEPNPFAGENARPVLDYAHGGFAYDHREGKGEVYWFLQGAGILRIHRDRSKIELVETDPEMVKFNMHNATFFEHGGEGMIAWPANSGERVFVTDTEGKVLQTIGRPTVEPYATQKAGYAPTDTAYLDGLLWVTDGYASKYIMSFDVEKKAWTGTIFGGRTDKPEPGKFGTNHGITIH
ncbi:MAG: hypothetical protein H6834_17415, partial [Planctomycetes bacterium]|nr:hypothetical protein [Planctomycetota bacterium]